MPADSGLRAWKLRRLSEASLSNGSDPAPPTDRRRLRTACAAIGAVALALTLTPYLVGQCMAGERIYLWLGYNLDDSCVYLSWMRQAAEGSLRAYNLFTTEPQHGMALNPLFLVMGRMAGWTGLSLLAINQIARIGFGALLLAVVYRFARSTVRDSRALLLAFLFVCFSSGLGWLPIWWDNPLTQPIDKWQPEAITFLSLLLSPLFCFSMALQVAIFALLVQGERTGRVLYALEAGGCGFLLGFVHSYDVISVSCVWIAYLFVMAASGSWIRGVPDRNNVRRPGLASMGRALVAGIVAAPAVLYIWYQLHTETVFRERAEVPTLAPALVWVIAGYGLTLALACVGAWAATRGDALSAPGAEPNGAGAGPRGNTAAGWTYGLDAATLIVVWAVVNVAVSYLPHTPFQRKLIQGAHVPIAILAGIGAADLYRHWSSRRDSPIPFAAYATIMTCLLAVTNGRFVAREIENATMDRVQTQMHRPYLQRGELEALDWVKQHGAAGDALQPMPWVGEPEPGKIAPTDFTLACVTPGFIDRHVYAGHWGETPEYGAKLTQLVRFALPSTDDAHRVALLRAMRVRFLIWSQKGQNDEAADRLAPMFRGLVAVPPYLALVHSNHDADVYEVKLPTQ